MGERIADTHLREEVRKALIEAGAVAVGFAAAGDVSEGQALTYDRWIKEGKHAGMEYLPRHALLKKNPRNVLESVRTVITTAWSHHPAEWRADSLPQIACYAWGDDYHDVLRRRIAAAISPLMDSYGGDWRICIDSAPIAERYWAVRSGIARRGLNGSVIVDNFGSDIFLAEVLTSHQIAPDAPEERFCDRCGACVRRCPTGALKGDGTVDARRCLSYLTIEHRGEWSREGEEAMNTPVGRATLFGCDICRRVCPHNRDVPPTAIAEFSPRPGMLELTAEEIRAMTQEEFSRRFKGSPLKRARLAGLLRNAR